MMRGLRFGLGVMLLIDAYLIANAFHTQTHYSPATVFNIVLVTFCGAALLTCILLLEDR